MSVVIFANAIQTVDETLDQYRRTASDPARLEANNDRYLTQYRRMIPQFGNDRLEIVDAVNHVRASAGPSRFINEHNSCSLNGVYLYDFLRRHGFDQRVELVDNIDLDRARSSELARAADVAVVSTTFITSASTITRICRDVRAWNPQIKIVVGGAKLTQFADDEEIHEAATAADALILSTNGELTLLEVIRRLVAGESVRGMPNVAHDNGGFTCAARNEYDGVDIDANAVRWGDLPSSLLRSSVNLRTGRGCPFKCKFCTFPSYNDQKMELMTVDTVVGQLRMLQPLPQVKSVRFVDDTLFLSRRHLIETCKRIIEMGWDRAWTAYLRASTLTDECTRLLAEAGCRLVLVGIESADQVVLNNMRKGTKESHNWEAARHLRKYGIFCFAFIIVGFPGESEASVTKTIKFLNQSGVDGYVHSPLFVFPNSPLAQEAKSFGLRGGFNDWHHETMDCARATDECERIFNEVTEAGYIDRGSSVAKVLLDHGLSVEEVRTLAILHNRLARDINAGTRDRTLDDFTDYSRRGTGSTTDGRPITSPYQRPGRAQPVVANAAARY